MKREREIKQKVMERERMEVCGMDWSKSALYAGRKGRGRK
jgi:hypothetical protein